MKTNKNLISEWKRSKIVYHTSVIYEGSLARDNFVSHRHIIDGIMPDSHQGEERGASLKMAACSGQVEGRNSARHRERQQPVDSRTSGKVD